MTNCAKCGAELIGSRKFCAACGAPAVDPATLKRDASVSAPASSPAPHVFVPSTPYGPPSQVNPFASTASPSSRGIASSYGPPPAPQIQEQQAQAPQAPATTPDPQATSPVSPLAFSNALSQRGAFQQIAGDAIPPEHLRQNTGTSPPPPPQAEKRIPGTQMMQSVPRPPEASKASSPSMPAASVASRRPDRTQLMDASAFARPNPAPQSTPPMPAAPPHAPVHPPPPMQPPTPQPWGGGFPPAPVPPPAQAPYGFGYAPGARVNVTWSNGQRYPATVSQVSGPRCLVVFPDGQQHWVDMQYLTPG